MNKPREEEKEIERALAGGKVYQIREVKKLLDQALSSQLKEVRDKIYNSGAVGGRIQLRQCNALKIIDEVLAEVEKLV